MIVLIHGLGRSRFSMHALARAGRRAGYATHMLGYASRRHDARAAAPQVAVEVATIARRLAGGTRLHVIAHSMGGLVTLFAVEALARQDPAALDRIGRVVLLAPPLGGSRMADVAYRIPPLRAVLGPALGSLRRGATGIDVAAALPVPLGIIAGSRSLLPGLDVVFGGGHDGRVAIEATRHPGAADHLTLPVDHGLMLLSRRVQVAALAFLAEGRFPPPDGIRRG